MVKKFKILSVLIACFININHAAFTYDQALANCDKLNLNIQKPDSDGCIQTLNKKGEVSEVFDYAMRKFLIFSKGKRVLEIGGCYGDVMLLALKKSEATKYVLSDLDERHLFIAAKCLYEKIKQNWLDPKSSNQVEFVQADITNTLHIQKLGQYDVIYVGNVFHLLTPEQFELAVKNLSLLLKPKGQIYVTAFSPYLKPYKDFIPEYKKSVKTGKKYPGFIKYLGDYVNIDGSIPLSIKNMLGDPFFSLDVKTLRGTFQDNGFKVLECKYVPFSRKSRLWSYDGREYVIIIAEKEAASD
ncbi:MAG: class I SAM-dependent methyltransferase [Alphaproteobacteria bacterium]